MCRMGERSDGVDDNRYRPAGWEDISSDNGEGIYPYGNAVQGRGRQVLVSIPRGEVRCHRLEPMVANTLDATTGATKMTIKAKTKVYDRDGVSGFEFVRDYLVGTSLQASHLKAFGDAEDPITGLPIPWFLRYYIENRKSIWETNSTNNPPKRHLSDELKRVSE